MADEFDDFVRGVTQQAPATGPVPVPAGSGVDEFESFVKGAGASAPETPVAPVPAVDDSAGFEAFVKNGPTTAEAPGYGELFSGGVKRNVAQMKAAVPSIQAIYNETQGQQAEAVSYAKEAQRILSEAGDSSWEFKNIKNAEDFSYWLTEKLGEQSITALTMLMTGGVGGIGAKAVGQQLLERGLVSASSVRALTLAGAASPTAATNVGLETAGTSQEQFGVTGSTQPEISVAAGVAKGILETMVPFGLARSIINPLGGAAARGFASRVGITAAKEAGTEAAQEAVDIYARKISDPNYTFFGSGAQPWYQGPGFERMVESGAAGFFVGGVYVAPFARAGKAASAQVDETGQPLQAPGAREVIPGTPQVAPIKPEPILPMESRVGPVTELRRRVMPRESADPISQSLASNPKDDLLSLRPLIASSLPGQTRESFFDMLDANTPRYVQVGQDGNYGSRVYTDTELELENVLKKPQSERPRLARANPASFQPAAMTAMITDLAPRDSGRVWFIPGTKEADKTFLLDQYETLVYRQQEENNVGLVKPAEATTNPYFSNTYNELLTKGLRVVPSRGAGFYYNGLLKADPVSDLADTKRSLEIAMYDPINRQITPFHGDEALHGVMAKASDMFIPVSVDFNKVNKDDIIQNADGSFTLKQPLDIGKLVPGITLQAKRRLREMYEAPSGFFGTRGSKSYTSRFDVESGFEETGRRLEQMAKSLIPAVDKILKSLGIEHPVGIHVSDQGSADIQSAAWVHIDKGEIFLSPKYMEKSGKHVDDLEGFVTRAVMHELGHQVTYWYFRNLPVEVQDQLVYAYQKGLLSVRANPIPGIAPRMDLSDFPGGTHYLTFSEWLAEQFRRWSTSDVQPKNWIDKSFKEGGRAQERFFKAWEDRFGRNARIDLSEPDYHFSAAMEYLRDYGDEKRKLQQTMRQQTIYSIANELVDSPAAFQLTKQVQLALKSLEQIFPPSIQIKVNEQLQPGIVPGEHLPPSPDATGRWIHRPNDIKLIELAVASMKPESAFDQSRQLVAHEVMHAYEDLGLITPEEIQLLDQAIAEIPALTGLRMPEIAENVKLLNPTWSPEQVQLKVLEITAREKRAYYIQQFADGLSVPESIRSIAGRVLAILERIKNFLNGLGYQTREDVIRAFFKGEMAQRAEREGLTTERALRMSYAMEEAPEFVADAAWQVGNYKVEVIYEDSRGGQPAKKLDSHYVTYRWTDAAGRQVGSIELANKMPKGFNIEWVETKEGFPLGGMMMIREVEKDLGIPIKPAGELTEEGYQAAHFFLKKRGQADLLSLYRPLVATVKGVKQTMYVSPNRVKEQVLFYTALVKQMEKMKPAEAAAKYGMDQKRAIAWLTQWRVIMKKMPESYWTDPRLEQMFSLRRNEARDGVQGSMIRGGQRVDDSSFQASIGLPTEEVRDPFQDVVYQKQTISRGENARASGISFDQSAPATMLTYESRKLYEWATGYGNNPKLDRKLVNTTLHEKDRIGWFSKKYWGLHQISFRNPHIQGLLDYIQNAEFMNTSSNFWLRKADETARIWEKVPEGKRREAVADVLFKLSEMSYRQPIEVQNNIVRLPMNWKESSPGAKDGFLDGLPPVPGGELDRLFKTSKLDQRDQEIIRRVARDFQDFLTKVEAVRVKLLTKRIKSPATLAAELARLSKEMADLRLKPYFPMVRFGEFTVHIRDPNNQSKVVWASAYGTQAQRTSAIPSIQAKFPGMDLNIGRVPDSASEFLGLPAPLLRMIKEELLDKTGKTQEQKDLIDVQLGWIEEFEMIHAPDKTFRKRWMPSQGLPGYSMDAFRAYAHYFMSGSRYISRLEFMDELQSNIATVHGTVLSGKLGNTAKRQAIVKEMRDHYDYVMEAGTDNGKFRALVSLYFLGFSPAAAAMNFTQIPVVLYPWMAGHFGQVRALSVLSQGLNAGKAMRGKVTGSPAFQRAREEMINQGRIDVGQAPELGAFAEGNNLLGLQAGTKAQKFYRQASYWGMKMFGVVEQYNRELSLKAIWELAISQPQTRRMTEIDRQYPLEIGDLQRRVGLTHTEALAFMMAREGIDRSQFQYAKYTDPPFMRGKKKDLLIFFKYTQNMTFELAFGPGRVQMWMILIFLYGLSGVPGAEDLSELMRLLSKKIFGKDFDLEHAAREYVRGITRGTVFDKTGPDLALHGISRYGFGLGLLPEGWGAPKFDASANGSMGRLVPGLADTLHGINVHKDGKDVIADAAQKAAGAGYGFLFTLMQFMMEKPGSAESHKWEQLLPRAAHAAAKAWRYAPPELGLPDVGVPFIHPNFPGNLGVMKSQGAETTRGGAKLPGARFDVTDPADLTTVLVQALGFTPTKVSESWDVMRAAKEQIEVYKARKVALYAQYDHALRYGTAEVLKDLAKAVEDYNKSVRGVDPNQQISASQIQQAVKQRMNQRAMQEQFMARNRGELPVTKRILDLYPGVEVQNVK